LRLSSKGKCLFEKLNFNTTNYYLNEQVYVNSIEHFTIAIGLVAHDVSPLPSYAPLIKKIGQF